MRGRVRAVGRSLVRSSLDRETVVTNQARAQSCDAQVGKHRLKLAYGYFSFDEAGVFKI
jgi:hypothetical protein